jgi:hypothetical protein
MSDVPEPVTDSTPVVAIVSHLFVAPWLADALAGVGIARLRAVVVPAASTRSASTLARIARVALEQRSRHANGQAQPLVPVDTLSREVCVVENPKDVEAELEEGEIVLDLTEAGNVPRPSGHLILTLWHGASPAAAPDVLLDELLRGDSTVTSTVVAQYAGRTWEVTSARTALSRWSLVESRRRVAGKAAPLLSRSLRGVGHTNDTLTVAARPSGGAGSLHVAVAVARLAARAVRSWVSSLTTRTEWGVAWGARDRSHSPLHPPEHMNWVDHPADRFLADPFLARSDGTTFVFVEDFSHTRGYATIGVFEPRDSEGTFRTVLDRGTHLSYPFVFRDPADGSWLMLPEMAAERRVTLFRATSFPDEWSDDAVLLDDVTAFDPTVLFREGRYWLFYASGTPGSTGDDELYIFSSETLRGPYTPHPQNPIRSDPVGARPAGRFFEWNGRLIRPGQDSSRGYGYAVAFYEVTALSPTAYAEVEISRLEPDWASGIRGTHSWDFLDDIVVTDARRVARRWSLPFSAA